MNQSFKKKAIAASLAAAFVVVGAGVVSLPGVETIRAAQANAFEANAFTASAYSVTAKTVNTVTPANVAMNNLTIQEIANTGVVPGRIVMRIPSTVSLVDAGGTALTSTQLGTSSAPKDLVTNGAAGTPATSLSLDASGNALFTVMTGAAGTFVDWTNLGAATFGTSALGGYKVGQSYVDSDGSVVLTMAIGKSASASAVESMVLSGLTLKAKTASSTGDVNVSFEDAAAPYATGITAGSAKVMTMVNQPASLAGTASTAVVPSVATGAASPQPIGVMTFTFVGAFTAGTSTDTTASKITVSLNNGAKFHPTATTTLGGTLAGVASASVNPTGQLVITFNTGASVTDQGTVSIAANQLMIDTSAATAGSITATATGSGTGLTGFSGSTAVATAAARAATVAYKDDSTAGFTKLYAGRTTQATTDLIRISESAPGTLLASGTLSFALGGGAKYLASAFTFTECTASPCVNTALAINALTPTAAATTATTTIGTASDVAGGVYDVTLGNLDLTAAAAGDLNVTVSGSAGASGTVKLAEVINATSVTAATAPVVTAGSTVSVPEITVTEAKIGAIASGQVVGFDFGAGNDVLLATGSVAAQAGALTNATDLTVKVLKADGTDITTTAGVTINTGDAANGNTNARQLFITLANASTAEPYIIKITGLKVKTSSTAVAGNLNATVAGASSDGSSVIVAKMRAEAGTSWTSLASATKATVKFGQVIGNAPAIPAATATGAITAKTVTGSVVAGANDQGKLGTLYIAAYVPNVGLYLKNAAGSWVTYNAANPASAGTVTLGTHAIDVVSALDLSSLVGTEVYVGYGVGSTAFGATVPFNNMLSNGTYNLIYTVQ